MKNSVKIKGNKQTAKFFENVLAEKRQLKNEVRKKMKSGKLKIAD